jgi:hypothetical protein
MDNTHDDDILGADSGDALGMVGDGATLGCGGGVPSSCNSVMGIHSEDGTIGNSSATGTGDNILDTGTGDDVCLGYGGSNVQGASILVTGERWRQPWLKTNRYTASSPGCRAPSIGMTTLCRCVWGPASLSSSWGTGLC